MSSEMEKIKKRFDEFEEGMKKHMSEARQADRKRIDGLDARLMACAPSLNEGSV